MSALKVHQPLRMRVAGHTDIGRVRDHNEDSFIIADLTTATRDSSNSSGSHIVGERGLLLGVCDGMGGAAAGEVASKLAVDTIFQQMLEGRVPLSRDELAARLVQAIESANLRIFRRSGRVKGCSGMGTTATIALALDNHLFIGQVGDSRAYLLRGERLVQITRDQSLVAFLVAIGHITEEEAQSDARSNVIMQALGTSNHVDVDVTYVELRRGDTLLLCSDGLSGTMHRDGIFTILRTIEDPASACKALIEGANEGGGHDNIAVIVAKFEGEGLHEPTEENVHELCYQKYPIPESIRLQSTTSSEAPGVVMVEAPEEHSEDMIDQGAESPADESTPLPFDAAPLWLLAVMFAGAVTCAAIPACYLLDVHAFIR